MKTTSYKKIIPILKKPFLKAEMLFVIASAQLFLRFTKYFQKQEPLVHILYSEIDSLLFNLMGRVCKKEVMEEVKKVNGKVKKTDVFNKCNLLPLKDINCGIAAQEELKKLPGHERDQLTFMSDVCAHFVASGNHILKKMQESAIMKHFRCFQPLEKAKRRSCQDILKLAKMLPGDINLDVLLDEWKLLQLDRTKADEKLRIDHYWRTFFSQENSTGEKKYPTVVKVVKMCLAVSHGSADIERGFSLSARILTEERASMSERTLNARLTVKDALKMYSNKPELVPITHELLGHARTAYKSYSAYLEGKKQKREEETKKQQEEEREKIKEAEKAKEIEREKVSIKSMELELAKIREDEERQKYIAEKLFKEANNRLKEALKKKDLTEVGLAQAMIEGVQNSKSQEDAHRSKAKTIEKKLEKRKSNLVTIFLKKKAKLSENVSK